MSGLDLSPETFKFELAKAHELFGTAHRDPGLHVLFDSSNGRCNLFYAVAPTSLIDSAATEKSLHAGVVLEAAGKVFGVQIPVDLATAFTRPGSQVDGVPVQAQEDELMLTDYSTGYYELCKVVRDAEKLSFEDRRRIAAEFIAKASKVRELMDKSIDRLERTNEPDGPDI